MSSNSKLLGNSIFKNKKPGSSDLNESKDLDDRKRAALDLVKQNCTVMNAKAKKALRDTTEDDMFEVPATQVSPNMRRRTVDFSFASPKAIENKSLKRLQRQDRHSMVSSPSMMKPKQEPEQRKQPKTADAIFEEMKKSEEASQAVIKAAAEKIDTSAGSTSSDEKDKIKTEQQVPVVPPAEESRDWTKISSGKMEEIAKTQHGLTQSLRSILEELKKTNEKITEFRQKIINEV